MDKSKFASKAFLNIVDQRTKTLRDATDMINEAVENSVRRVPESYFYVKIFPIVRDWLEGRENSNTGLWFNVANSPTNEIIVIDDDTEEEVFRCPPATLLHSINHAIPGDRNITLEHLLSRQDLLAKAGDTRAALEIEGSFANTVNISTNGRRYLENIKQFLWIYERYELTASDLFGESAPEIVKVLNEAFPDSQIKVPQKDGQQRTHDPDSSEPDFDVSNYDY